MGNSSSSSSRSHDETVDFGFLTPQGVYTGPRDWNQTVVTQLICARRLAPFYRPLEDYDDSWTDDQILAARKELPDAEGQEPRLEQPPLASSVSSKASHSKRPNTLKEPSKPEAAVYRGAAECPICFLYYPPNINHSRCCDQAICTECFVQIKRSEPTTTHLVSDPAACPYCVQENFGVVYTPPPWRAGIGSEGSPSSRSDSPKHSSQSDNPPTHKRRQKSFSADSPEVVTTDQIRPDWEAKLAAVRAAVTRRANRRIIMRQVGDRLIPVGVTSGRVHALSPEEAATVADNGNGGTWRSRRRRDGGGAGGAGGLEQYLGQDLEELMMMEAMRLSLIEHEAQQKREAEEKQKAEEQVKNVDTASEPIASDSGSGPVGASTSSASIESPSTPSTSHQKNDSLRVKKGSIFSRSRSPSPVPPVSKQSSVPPFSTLGAALTSTNSTASAILRSSYSNSDSNSASIPIPENYSETSQAPLLPKDEATNPAASSILSLPSSSSSTTPSITIAPVATSPIPQTTSPDSLPTLITMASVSPISPLTDADASELYESLPSSPEENTSEPLIPRAGKVKMENTGTNDKVRDGNRAGEFSTADPEHVEEA